jgi:hypothetical protein
MNMDKEKERLIEGLIEGETCYLCSSNINLSPNNLETDSENLYTAEYQCTGCDVIYDIEIEDLGHILSFSAYRRDIENELDVPQMSRNTRKESLHEQTHPAKDLVESLEELINVLIILQQNKNRINQACDNIRQEGGFDTSSDFDRRVQADLHNYMASSYSFEEVLATVEPNLPTGGPVESAWDTFHEENQVIKGLRTYAQHHRSLPHSYTQFNDENTDQMEVGITVSLEDVGEDEVEDFNYGDPSISYKKVKGDLINVERRVELHYEAAEELVNQIFKYTESERGEELEDYHELTTYDFEK